MDEVFQIFLIAMSCTAVLVFFALNRIDAGYGLFYDKKWGISLPNKISWIIMEAPVFFSMLLLWYFSEKASNPVLIVFLVFFELHYFQRSFIFPFLIRGKNRMPLSIVLMGIVFNLLNALMQGGWIFHIAPSEYYSEAWFKTPQFIIGTIVFPFIVYPITAIVMPGRPFSLRSLSSGITACGIPIRKNR